MSPNLALAAIRAYGTEATKKELKKKVESKSICHDLIRRSGLYSALTTASDTSRRSERKTEEGTQNEFLRLQQNAKSNDKELNKAVAAALTQTLLEDGYSGFNITCEKQELEGTTLKPDIQIGVSEKEVICLELTWRTTGTAVLGELASRQSTISVGHIQKYVLEKTMEYIKELEL